MSRFIEVLQAYGSSLSGEKLPSFLEKMAQHLDSKEAHLKISFPFFIEKEAPVSRITSLLSTEISWEATLKEGICDIKTFVTASITTLCPCSKAISERSAHNQRGRVTLGVKTSSLVSLRDLISLIEKSGSAELFALLKRPDEKWVTEHAYEHPVFVEDVARNVALLCNQNPAISWYSIEVENEESIHRHNAFAFIEKNLS